MHLVVLSVMPCITGWFWTIAPVRLGDRTRSTPTQVFSTASFAAFVAVLRYAYNFTTTAVFMWQVFAVVKHTTNASLLFTFLPTY